MKEFANVCTNLRYSPIFAQDAPNEQERSGRSPNGGSFRAPHDGFYICFKYYGPFIFVLIIFIGPVSVILISFFAPLIQDTWKTSRYTPSLNASLIKANIFSSLSQFKINIFMYQTCNIASPLFIEIRVIVDKRSSGTLHSKIYETKLSKLGTLSQFYVESCTCVSLFLLNLLYWFFIYSKCMVKLQANEACQLVSGW